MDNTAMLECEKSFLQDKVKELEKEIEELKGFREAYLGLYSDLYGLQSCSDEELPLSVQALVESYGMNYKNLNLNF